MEINLRCRSHQTKEIDAKRKYHFCYAIVDWNRAFQADWIKKISNKCQRKKTLNFKAIMKAAIGLNYCWEM